MPFMVFTLISVGTFVNTSTVFMLRDPLYFNINKDEIGRVSNDLIFYAVPPALIVTCFIGYVFDIVGRRITLSISIGLQSIMVLLMPYTSPEVYPWLLILRMGLSVFWVPLFAHPLVSDYIKKESRGKQIALNGIGFICGDVFAFGILLNITRNMPPIESFSVTSVYILVTAITAFFMIKEPELNKIHQKAA